MKDRIKIELGETNYAGIAKTVKHHIVFDEPETLGGLDTGMTPNELLLSALGSCAAITIKMYAQRKGWDVKEVIAHLDLSKNEDGKTIFTERFEFIGNLDDAQKERLLKIAKACPVAKAVTGDSIIESGLV